MVFCRRGERFLSAIWLDFCVAEAKHTHNARGFQQQVDGVTGQGCHSSQKKPGRRQNRKKTFSIQRLTAEPSYAFLPLPPLPLPHISSPQPPSSQHCIVSVALTHGVQTHFVKRYLVLRRRTNRRRDSSDRHIHVPHIQPRREQFHQSSVTIIR